MNDFISCHHRDLASCINNTFGYPNTLVAEYWRTARAPNDFKLLHHIINDQIASPSSKGGASSSPGGAHTQELEAAGDIDGKVVIDRCNLKTERDIDEFNLRKTIHNMYFHTGPEVLTKITSEKTLIDFLGESVVYTYCLLRRKEDIQIRLIPVLSKAPKSA